MPEIKGRNARQKSHAEAVAAYGGNRKSERGGRGKNTEVIPYKAFPLPSLSKKQTGEGIQPSPV